MHRSKPWLQKVVLPLVGLALLFVLLLLGVQRKAAPFNFLASESYRGTVVYSGVPPWQFATQQYICDSSPLVMIEKAKKELALKGWNCKSEVNGHLSFTSKDGSNIELSIASGSGYPGWAEVHDKTVVLLYREPTAIDRIRARLDRLILGSLYDPIDLTSITSHPPPPSRPHSS